MVAQRPTARILVPPLEGVQSLGDGYQHRIRVSVAANFGILFRSKHTRKETEKTHANSRMFLSSLAANGRQNKAKAAATAAAGPAASPSAASEVDDIVSGVVSGGLSDALMETEIAEDDAVEGLAVWSVLQPTIDWSDATYEFRINGVQGIDQWRASITEDLSCKKACADAFATGVLARNATAGTTYVCAAWALFFC